MRPSYLSAFAAMVLRRAAAVVLLTFGLLGPAAADGLFSLLPGELTGAAAAQQTPGLGVIRSRDVVLDSAYLAARIAPQGVDNAANRLALAPPAAPVRIELFTGYTVDLRRTSISEAFGGGFIWTGQSARGGTETANLVIRKGLVTGTVDFGKHTYRIDPLGVGKAHRISELDTSAFPEDIEMPVKVPPGEKRSEADQTEAITEITILMPYTARAVTSLGPGGDIVAQANLGVSRSNTAYQRSNVEITLRLVGTPLVNGYDEQATGKTYNSILEELTNNTTTGPFQPVHAARDALGADLVALLIDRPEFCGLAWKPDNPSAQSANLGMSVNTVANCIAVDVIAHEAGHNMGLDHDRFVVNPAPPNTDYNLGFVSLPGQFRDIMSYNDQCAQANVQCQQINNFANPNVQFNGFATGIPAGQNGAADGARRLNETKAGVASYRATPPGTTPALLAAVTPVARATAVGGTVTAFATILNTGNVGATTCSIAMPAGQPVTFSYSGRNPGTGAPENPDQPVNIPAGGQYDFLMSFTPTAAIQANLALVFDCANSAPAPSVAGLNTFLLTGTAGAAPADLVSIAVTATNDGIANIPLGGTGFAALAAINIGAGANLQARLQTNAIGAGNNPLPLTLSMCQTDLQGGCISAQGGTVDFAAGANQTVTFSAFATSNGTPIAFDPAGKRMFVHFFQGNTPVGSASVAVRTTANDASIAAASAN
jgi:hypothetical protein